MRTINFGAYVFMLCIVLSVNGKAQKGISIAPDSTLRRQLEMKSYKNDTSVSAVLLYDYGKVNIDKGYDEKFKRYYTSIKKIKIFNRAGMKYSKLSIPLDNIAEEEITNIEGVTYNLEDGKVVRTVLTGKQVSEERLSKVLVMRHIEMPAARPGSIIYLIFTIRSNNVLSFGWNFQNYIPVDSSEFYVSIPPFYEYTALEQRLDSTCKRGKEMDLGTRQHGGTQYQNVTYSYKMTNVPPFTVEKYITTPNDYIIRIAFQLAKMRSADMVNEKTILTSWLELGNVLENSENFGGYCKPNKKDLRKILTQLNIADKSTTDKIRCIVNYVKQNYKWNQVYSVSASTKLNDFLDDKTGNSADINLFLISLLNTAGINTYPVILSTREHGKIKANYPYLDFFCDVIGYITNDSVSLLVDGTRPQLPFYAIPIECINDYGLIVRSDSVKWVNLSSPVVSSVKESMILKFSPGHDTINGSFAYKTTGYEAYIYRRHLSKGSLKLDSALRRSKNEILDTVNVSHFADPEEPFIMTFRATYPSFIEGINDAKPVNEIGQMRFTPFLSEVISKNPFKNPDREYPVDFTYPTSFEYSVTIAIPIGYSVYKKPGDDTYFMKNGDASFFYNITMPNDNVIQVTSKYVLNKAVYPPEEYQELKKFFDEVVKKYNEERQ